MIILLAALAVTGTSCIDDEFATGSDVRLAFSVDTVAFDTVITKQGTATKQFVVYNRGDKMVNISSIKVAGVSEANFFLNVDGVKGDEFHDVEVRGGDSIYVFVESYIGETNLSQPVKMLDRIDFETNGVTQSVILSAWAQDVVRLLNTTLDADYHMTAEKPYLIYDSLVVAPTATLTIDAGATLLFHDDAWLKVEGKVKAHGEVGKEIVLRGDRLDHVVGEIGFDIMSGQWRGVVIEPGSYGNVLSHVLMRGTRDGLKVLSTDPTKLSLHMLNCVLHNATNNTFLAVNAKVEAFGTEFSNAGRSAARLEGGDALFGNCTFANYYLFDISKESIVCWEGYGKVLPKCTLNNCIIYGLSSDINIGDLMGLDIVLRNCLLKSDGDDDAHFISCVWAGDPKFYVDREKYIFDFRLQNESNAIAKGNSDFCPNEARYDRYGVDRLAMTGLDLGAYAWVQAAE